MGAASSVLLPGWTLDPRMDEYRNLVKEEPADDFMTSYENFHRRRHLMRIAYGSLDVIQRGTYILPSLTSFGVREYLLRDAITQCKKDTLLFLEESRLSDWLLKSSSRPHYTNPCEITMKKMSTLEGARYVRERTTDSANSSSNSNIIGVLNFASATKPGGGFLNGAQAQEESIARSSTLYASIKQSSVHAFYDTHRRNPKHGFFSHAMIYSPGVVLFRDDDGELKKPVVVDVLTSCAVHAGYVRETLSHHMPAANLEKEIELAMAERMARILFLFEQQCSRHLVLGSFGTGVYKNDVEMVARVWADLLATEESRFRKSFKTVVFAIPDRKTFSQFKKAFAAKIQEAKAEQKTNNNVNRSKSLISKVTGPKMMRMKSSTSDQ